MFTSELNLERKKVLMTGVIDLCVSFMLWLFSAIYIACGHGKTSGGMTCLLLPFFIAGMALLVLSLTNAYKLITLAVRCLCNLSIASFSVGMALVGIFEIAGVSQSVFVVPIWIGGVLCAIACTVIIILNGTKKSEDL